MVLVAYDERGQIIDFGSLEVQAVYISGNIRSPFEYYMEDPQHRHDMDWAGRPNYPRPDYLSSSRKRLVPQLIFKGGILTAWGKKQAVALHRSFFETLPVLTEVAAGEADMAWLIYDLALDTAQQRYHLVHARTVHTRFKPALDAITTPMPGPMEPFVAYLQHRLDEQLGEERNPPDAPTLDELL